MREIKFRAWDTKDNRMIDDFTNYAGWMAFKRLNNEWRNKRYVIEQFTGIKDKNGREIYEGDIVSTPYYIMNKEVDREQHAVIFQNGCFGIERENRFICLADLRQATKFDYVSNVGDVAVAWDSPFEVIGNIHE